jgi:hypothetical protein
MWPITSPTQRKCSSPNASSDSSPPSQSIPTRLHSTPTRDRTHHPCVEDRAHTRGAAWRCSVERSELPHWSHQQHDQSASRFESKRSRLQTSRSIRECLIVQLDQSRYLNAPYGSHYSALRLSARSHQAPVDRIIPSLRIHNKVPMTGPPVFKFLSSCAMTWPTGSSVAPS